MCYIFQDPALAIVAEMGNALKTGIVNVQMDSLGLIAQLVSFNSKNVSFISKY
jgi:hypothetical protein